MADNKLSKRVVEFLTNSDIPLQRISTEYVSEELKLKYSRDYARKPKVPFQIAVGKILKDYMKKMKLDVDLDQFDNPDDCRSPIIIKRPHSFSNLNDLVSSGFKKSDQSLNCNKMETDELQNTSDLFCIDTQGSKRFKHDIENSPKNDNHNSINTSNESSKELKNKITNSLTESVKNETAFYKILKPKEFFSNLIGLDAVISELKSTFLPIKKNVPHLCPRGILITGPKGSGKSVLAKSIATELDLPLVCASFIQLMAGMANERGGNVKKLFHQAINMQPSFILIEDLDLIENRNYTLLSSLIENIDNLNNFKHKVWLIATAKWQENFDTELICNGRFEKNFQTALPNESNRTELLKMFVEKLKTKQNFSENDSPQNGDVLADETVHNFQSNNLNYDTLSLKTHSYSCYDLQLLIKEALIQSLIRHGDDSNTEIDLDMFDFEKALAIVKPSKTIALSKSSTDDNINHIRAKKLKHGTPYKDKNKSSTETKNEFTKTVKPIKDEAAFAPFQILKTDEVFSDLVGLDDIIGKLKVILLPFKERKLNLCSRGILISGPNGCGKNTLARCIATELNLPLINTSGRQLMVGATTERVENVQKLFQQAVNMQPCLILIDDIDQIECKNDLPTSASEKPLLNNLLINIDLLNRSKSEVWLIGLAGKRENVDPEFLRDDRFDDDFRITLPDALNRAKLLKIFVENFKKDECSNCTELVESQNYPCDFQLNDADYKTLSFKTPSYSCRDLRKLVKKAILQSLYAHKTGCRHEKEHAQKFFQVCMTDFEEALCIVKPTTMIEDTITIPEVTWKDIGALQDIREELVWSILNRIKNPVLMSKCGPLKSKGVMLFGPPGCGKTLVAKALANEASINFLSVKGPELIDKYVGESERNIRSLFQRAKECSPCLIFFDEIDSISERRSSHANGGGTKVVQQLLTLLDGVENRDGVFVMGATNRLDCVDPAFLRGNRFGNLLYVGLPSSKGRAEILQSITKNGTIPKMADDVNLENIADDKRCEGLSGADLSELVDLATTSAWKANYSENVVDIVVASSDFENALSQIRPSVSSADLASYEKVARQFNLKNFRL